MKVSAVLALVAATAVVAADTNAFRFARGLAPNPPAKRATPVEAARRHMTSSTPSSCGSNQSMQCCSSTAMSGQNEELDGLMSLLGASAPSGTMCGSNCNTIGGSTECNQQTLCCDDNSFSGLVVIGCVEININIL